MGMETQNILHAHSLGALIRQKRKAQKLRIDTAAMYCHVSVQFLHDLEKGKATVQFDKAVHVARMMGISLYACDCTLEGFTDA